MCDLFQDKNIHFHSQRNKPHDQVIAGKNVLSQGDLQFSNSYQTERRRSVGSKKKVLIYIDWPGKFHFLFHLFTQAFEWSLLWLITSYGRLVQSKVNDRLTSSQRLSKFFDFQRGYNSNTFYTFPYCWCYWLPTWYLRRESRLLQDLNPQIIWFLISHPTMFII